MKLVLSLTLVLIIAFTLAGCAFPPIEDMLSPPRLTDEQQAIYTALITSKGSGFKLKYPRTGEHRSAFVVYGDNSAALVFYEVSGINIERALLMNFLYKDSDGKWESLYEIPIRGNDIDSVSFTSFGEDEEDVIFLSYFIGQGGQGGHGERRCMVLRDIYGNPTIDFQDGYSFMSVDYFLGKEYKELLIIKNERSVQSATITLYTYREGQLRRSGSSRLDPDAGEYISVTEGFIAENAPALFISHKKYNSSDTFGMDVVFYRGARLFNPIADNLDNIDRAFQRTSNVTELAAARDIDGSGVFLIPSSMGEFPGYGNLPSLERLRPVEWRRLEGDDLVDRYRSYYTERLDFVFLLPGRWYNTVTAFVNTEENTVSFFAAGMPVEEADDPVLSIKTVFPEEADPDFIKWKFYKSGVHNGLKYYINRAVSDDPLALTDEELESSFVILSEITATTEEYEEYVEYVE